MHDDVTSSIHPSIPVHAEIGLTAKSYASASNELSNDNPSTAKRRPAMHVDGTLSERLFQNLPLDDPAAHVGVADVDPGGLEARYRSPRHDPAEYPAEVGR
jgi:hypothetical protein